MRSGIDSRLRWAKSFIQSQKDSAIPPKAQIEGNAVRSIFVQAGIKEERMLKAIYHCIQCWSERFYGNSAPDNITAPVWLQCVRCSKHTQHRYSRMAYDNLAGGLGPAPGPQTINSPTHEEGKLVGKVLENAATVTKAERKRKARSLVTA